MNKLQHKELAELLSAIKSGVDSDLAFAELVRIYEPMMLSKVSSAFGGVDAEAMQEAHIALHNAAVNYDGEHFSGVTFGLFAGICVSNKLKDLIRNKTRAAEREEQYSDEAVDAGADVEGAVLTRDLCDRVLNTASGVLSDLEYKVFCLDLEGYTTRDIAARLLKSAKSVDNAKQRICSKLRRCKQIKSIFTDI